MGIKNLAKNYIRQNYGTLGEVGALGVLAAAAFVAESELEKDELTYAYYEVDSKGKADDNFRLVFLTDLHEKEFGDDNCQLLEMIEKADPDVVLIGGDMTVVSKHGSFKPKVRNTFKLCKALTEKYPVYFGNGNHEQRLERGKFRNALNKLGVRYLSNERTDWKYNVSIAGLDLTWDQYKPLKPDSPDINFIDRRLGPPDERKFNILLAHSPMFLDSYAKSGVDLVLCGHFHGGTIRLGEKVGLMTPQYQFFNTNVVGEQQKGHTKMIISSGLGTHTFNIRINNKPQVVVVDIKK